MRAVKAALLSALALLQGIQAIRFHIAFPQSSGVDASGQPISLNSFFTDLLHAPSTEGVRIVYTPSSFQPMDMEMTARMGDVEHAVDAVFRSFDAFAQQELGLRSNLRAHRRPRVCLHRCREDIQRLCVKSGGDVSYEAVVNCLRRSKESVSPRCIAVLKSQGLLDKARAPPFAHVDDTDSEPRSPAEEEAKGVGVTHSDVDVGKSGDAEEPPQSQLLPKDTVASAVEQPPSMAKEDVPEIPLRDRGFTFDQGFVMSVVVEVLLIMAIVQIVLVVASRVRGSVTVASKGK